ncbi:EB module domain-containing protein [Ditylenchus destructor]|uniref:EB module domain-containing protein n=1 Tax=Ditylenchus destructor TaxID=166010 RepID=A0AAD4NE58_9BILA|nr:EB module domain-containing protein [Ditylenchus destructor]
MERAVWAVSISTSPHLHKMAAFIVPCTQKLIGSKCLFDEECYGTNTVCRESRCTCPTNFEEYDMGDGKTICRLAPSRIGDQCQKDCKPPLLCRDGKCDCWGGSIVDGKCTVPCPPDKQLYGLECEPVARLGQPCKQDKHCVDPFNSCVGGTCQCTPGTYRDPNRNKCFAVCPDGMHPQQSCRRLFLNDIDMIENAATTDSCPIGFRCVTYGSPYIGHCCRLRCPYGEPDLTQSCDAGAVEEQKCRPLTHFCFTLNEPGWKTSLCCPKPCRDPTPVFSDGQCLSIAHRDDPCQTDQQTNDDRFPSCEKSCAVDEVPVMDKCLKKMPLDGRCVSNKQCGESAECRFGLCQCFCGFKEGPFGSRCTNPGITK